jgi:hypothetical protein
MFPQAWSRLHVHIIKNSRHTAVARENRGNSDGLDAAVGGPTVRPSGRPIGGKRLFSQTATECPFGRSPGESRLRREKAAETPPRQ